MNILELEHLLALHALVLEKTGGSEGIRDLGRLEAALATQTQNVFGEELYPGILDKAAAMIRGIIADHPFVDGNKRTALLSGLTFIKINGIFFEAEKGDIESFAIRVATDKLDIPQIIVWLSQRTAES
jgi:death-on-curing protein